MRKLLVLLMALAVVGAAGCGDTPTTPERGVYPIPVALTVPPEVETLLEQHTGFAGEIPSDAVEYPSAYAEADDDYDIYAILFLWGQLATCPVADVAPTDWSGALRANAEAQIDVRWVIAFEPGEDSILPVTTPMSVEWVSLTGCDFDGILFRVALKRGNTYITPPTLVFETAPITLRLPFHELDHYIAYYPVSNAQGVAVLARRIWSGDCPSGALRGEWVRETNTGDRGTFQGVWLDADGTPAGIYAGRFWMNNDGRGEFAGWVSGYYTDQIIAEMRGNWWYDDPRLCPVCGDDHGWFRGKVRYGNNDAVGVVSGEFGDFVGDVDRAALPMLGVWKMICPFDSERSANQNSP